MVHVIARMQIKEGKMSEMLAAFMELVPLVRAEKGCIRYEICLDAEVDFGEAPDQQAITIVEAWKSSEELAEHLKAKHMAEFREKVGNLRLNSKVTVLTPKI